MSAARRLELEFEWCFALPQGALGTSVFLFRNEVAAAHGR